MTTDNGQRKGRQSPAKASSACHYCGEQGHCITKYPARIRENADRQWPAQRADIAQSEDDSGDCPFSVGENSRTTKSSCEWLVDSGATQHMTSSRDKDFSSVDIHLADDGVVQAIGTGDIEMSMKTPHGMKKGYAL